MSDFKMQQVEAEIVSLIEVFKREGVKSYLEIGSKFGGSLWRIGTSLPPGSRVISIDLLTLGNERSLYQCIAELDELGYESLVIKGDSKDPKVIEQAKRLGPFDAIMIDGDHTRAGVFADWENYSPMGRLIAFHDISWFRVPTWQGTRIDVPELWNYLRRHYKHAEFRFCLSGKSNGIGVIWREQGRLPGAVSDVVHP